MKTFLPISLLLLALTFSSNAQTNAGPPLRAAITNTLGFDAARSGIRLPHLSPPEALRPPHQVKPTVRVPWTNPMPVTAINTRQPPAKVIRPCATGAVANFGRAKVHFATTADDPAPVTITAPDGRVIQCRATFLVLHDSSLTNNGTYLLGEVTNSVGEINSDSEIIFTNVFDTIQASLRYVYRQRGSQRLGRVTELIQDVILQENFDLPAGFHPESTTLEVWTRWDGAAPRSTKPRNVVLRKADASGSAVVATDVTVDFGGLKIIGEGRAFSLETPDDSIPVAKTWSEVEGKPGEPSAYFLTEATDYKSLKPKLDKLPKSSRHSGSLNGSRSDLIRRLALRGNGDARQVRRAAFVPKAMVLAQSSPLPKTGLVLDFILVTAVPLPSGAVSWCPANGDPNDAVSINNGTLVGATYGPGEVDQAFLPGRQQLCPHARQRRVGFRHQQFHHRALGELSITLDALPGLPGSGICRQR